MGRESKVYRVFLSSTSTDLEEYRKQVQHALERMSFQTTRMEAFVAKPETPLKECVRLAAEADLLVVIVAHRYGWVPTTEEGQGICQNPAGAGPRARPSMRKRQPWNLPKSRRGGPPCPPVHEKGANHGICQNPVGVGPRARPSMRKRPWWNLQNPVGAGPCARPSRRTTPVIGTAQRGGNSAASAAPEVATRRVAALALATGRRGRGTASRSQPRRPPRNRTPIRLRANHQHKIRGGDLIDHPLVPAEIRHAFVLVDPRIDPAGVWP